VGEDCDGGDVGHAEKSVSVGKVLVTVVERVTGNWLVIVVVAPGMVEVRVTVTSEVQVPLPEEDWGLSAQEVSVEVTVDGGRVVVVVAVSVEMELETTSEVPKRVDVGDGVQAIVDAVSGDEEGGRG